MSDDEILNRLRLARGEATAVELAELLDQLTGGGLSQGSLVMYLGRAFPGIPLRILRAAGAWTRVGGKGLTDDEFNELLRPWVGK